MSLTYGTSMTATPSCCEQRRDARDEAVQVGDVGQHVVGVEHVGPLALGDELARASVRAEELAERRNAALLAGDLGDVARRLDAQHRHAAPSW